jgi:hypothetical protein
LVSYCNVIGLQPSDVQEGKNEIIVTKMQIEVVLDGLIQGRLHRIVYQGILPEQ